MKLVIAGFYKTWHLVIISIKTSETASMEYIRAMRSPLDCFVL